MDIMGMEILNKNKAGFLVYALITSQTAFAATFEFTPTLLVDETYSDNISLTLNGDTSSLISQTGIELESHYLSKLVSFNHTSKSLYATYSHDHNLDNDYHMLASDIEVKLWPDGLSLIGSVSIDHRAENDARNALADIIYADTIKVESYSGGLQYQAINSQFIINSSIVYNDTRYEDGFGDRKGSSGNIITRSGSSNSNYFWDINGGYQDIKNNQESASMYQGELKLGLITAIKLNPFIRYYDEENEGSINGNRTIESNSYGIGARWLITPKLQLDIAYNTPVGNALDLNGKKQSDYVSSKLDWQPTERTRLTAGFSQRFYGDSYNLSFIHKNKRLTNSINYSEDVQILTRNNYIPFEIGTYWCPNQDRVLVSECYSQNSENINFDNYELVTVQDFIVEEDDQFSINKQLGWQSALALTRTTFIFNVTANSRENISTKFTDERGRTGFTISRKVSGKLTIEFDMNYSDNTFKKGEEDERRDRYRQYQLSFKKSLNQKLAIEFNLGLVNRDSNNAVFNYEEGRVAFNIKKDF
jgi:uncharacterized protein (PEP-CTERM system associated)